MDLRTLRDPAGPLPAAVYWRRRLLVLAVVLVVVFLLARACTGGDDKQTLTQAAPTPARSVTTPKPTTPKPPTPTPTPSPTATATARPSAQAVAACAPAALLVSASTDADSYPAGVLPRLTLTVQNTGARACAVSWGPGLRKFTVFSGSDRVWATADCPQSAALARTTLAPRATRSATLVWSRHRSVPGCASEGPAAQPGTYRFYARYGDVVGDPAVFHLTS